uniref:Uncharacterized protein n=1 Tax=Compsopogon caeruleus TaxID=31354 RepID=A0A7S1TCQ1_9RHOD
MSWLTQYERSIHGLDLASGIEEVPQSTTHFSSPPSCMIVCGRPKLRIESHDPLGLFITPPRNLSILSFSLSLPLIHSMNLTEEHFHVFSYVKEEFDHRLTLTFSQ